MSNLFICSVNIKTLETDVKNAFSTYISSDDLKKPMMMCVAGEGRIGREFVDYILQGIDSFGIGALALVRNDLFIQFLVSSINLRASKTRVKAFKTNPEAIAWLKSLPFHAYDQAE